MTALYIILGILASIVALFIILLSINAVITVHYEGDVTMTLKWLFLKFNILPGDKKKKKKEKKKKEKSEPESEIVEEPKKKKDNMFVNFYRNKGVDGVVQLLKDTADAIGGMFKRIGKSLIIEELIVSLRVSAGDSAETAVKYGKTCAAAFPAMGAIVNTLCVRKYDIEVVPDFIYGTDDARLHSVIKVNPRKLLNALIIVILELIVKVVSELLMHSDAPKAEVEKQNNKK